MDLFGWGVDLVFGTAYGALITVIALLAAIPYAAWQGARRLVRTLKGGRHGHA